MSLDLTTLEKLARAKSTMWQTAADEKDRSPHGTQAAVSAYTAWSATSHAASQTRTMTEAHSYDTMLLLAKDATGWGMTCRESVESLTDQLKELKETAKDEELSEEDRKEVGHDIKLVKHALKSAEEADRNTLMVVGFLQGFLTSQPEHQEGSL